MMQAILICICLTDGHLVIWPGCTTTTSGPPPGNYVCQRCFSEVIVERITKEQRCETPSL